MAFNRYIYQAVELIISFSFKTGAQQPKTGIYKCIKKSSWTF